MQKKFFFTLVLTLILFRIDAKEASPNTRTPPLKIGYTNIEYVLSFLPETKKIESEYISFEKQLKNQLDAKIEEFQQKAQTFQQGYEAMAEAVRKQKQIELQQLQKSLEQFQLESQEKLASKHTSLLKPVYEKIQSTIEQVAKEQGYTHIFNVTTGGIPVLLYASEEHNISDQVLKKLGASPDKGKKK